MAMQAPNFNFVDPGTPTADAAQMFLASARAAQQMRLNRQKMQLEERQQTEAERRTREIEARETQRLGLEERRVGQEDARMAEEQRIKAREEGIQDDELDRAAITKAEDHFNPKSANYNPAMGENVVRSRGGTVKHTPLPTAQDDAALVPAFMLATPPAKPRTAMERGEGATDDPNAVAAASQETPEDEPPPVVVDQKSLARPGAAPRTQIDLRGKTFDINPEEQQRGKSEYIGKRADAIEGMAAMDNSPFKDFYFKTISQMVRSEILDPDEAVKQANLFLSTDNMNDRAALMAAAREQAAKAQQGMARANLAEREQSGNLALFNSYNAEKQRFFQGHDIPKSVTGHQELKTALRNVMTPNGVVQQQALYGVIRSMQPGDPRISNADYDSINKTVLSLFGQGENWLAQLSEGRMGETKARQLYNALALGVNSSTDRLKRADSAFQSKFGTSIYAPLGEQVRADRQAEFGDLTGFGTLPDTNIPDNKPNLPGSDKVPKTRSKRSSSVTSTKTSESSTKTTPTISEFTVKNQDGTTTIVRGYRLPDGSVQTVD